MGLKRAALMAGMMPATRPTMFPIRDHNPSQTTPFVTYALIAANVLVFLYQLQFAGNDQALNEFYYHWERTLYSRNAGEQYEGDNYHDATTMQRNVARNARTYFEDF